MPEYGQHIGIIADIQHNCDISDARDHGIYSMCSMVLKLRNLYKWEKAIPPWGEPDPGDLLDWIEDKETYWADIAEEAYRPFMVDEKEISPYDPESMNRFLDDASLVYGAGLGRSLKAVFFLAERSEQRTVEGCPVVVLGREVAREMASPFAMVQESTIIIRRESLRYFLWDQIQELRSTCKSSMQYVLRSYGLLQNGSLDQELFRSKLDTMVEEEMDLFIYHEVGEMLQTTLDSGSLQILTARFPGSVIEFVCRAVKDILADTHPQGLIAYCAREQRASSLGLYLGFLDGLRKELFPEMAMAWQYFLESEDWSGIEQARRVCRERNLQLAEIIRHIAQHQETLSDDQVASQFHAQVTLPLGLDVPK